MHRTTRAALALVSVSVALSYLSQRPTEATPAFAAKEGVPCGYCHLRASGGGRRNYRGKFYAAHGLSFAGFDDAAEAKAAGSDIAPFADAKPKSLTPPAAPAAAPTPAPTPTPAPAATPAAEEKHETSVAEASEKAHAAKLAYEKSPKDAKLKAAYVEALAAFSHATLLDTATPAAKRFADAKTLAERVLKLDPKNASAKADLKAATAGLKAGKTGTK